MKNLILLFAAALFAIPGSAQGILFRDLTPEEAIAAAKAENKYVFADVYTDWCGPCKMMDQQVFPMKEMGDYFNPKFVSIKLNAETGDVGPAFKEKYGIKAYPTFVILDDDGNLLHMFAGGVLDLTFIDKVEASFDPAKAFGSLKDRYGAGDRDPKLVASYLAALASTHTVSVDEMIDEFYNSTSEEDKICTECLFIFDAYARVGSEKDDFITEHRDRFREIAGRKEVDALFKRKYVAYYGQLLQGYDRNATVESLSAIEDRLASLELEDMAGFAPMQAAALAKVTGKGVDNVFEMVATAVPALDEVDRNTLLFYVIIGLKDLFDQEQKDALVEMVTNESTKGYIVRSIAPR